MYPSHVNSPSADAPGVNCDCAQWNDVMYLAEEEEEEERERMGTCQGVTHTSAVLTPKPSLPFFQRQKSHFSYKKVKKS